MKTRRNGVNGMLAALVLAGSVQAAELSGVSLPDSADAGGVHLQLNGAALRTKAALFNVYVIGLYTASPTRDAASVVDSTQPRRLLLVMKRGLDASTLNEAFHDGLAANTPPAALKELQPQIAELDRAFASVGRLRENDQVQLDFDGEGRTRIRFDGQDKGSIGNKALAAALLRVWLGPQPVQDSVKQGLLQGGYALR